MHSLASLEWFKTSYNIHPTEGSPDVTSRYVVYIDVMHRVVLFPM